MIADSQFNRITLAILNQKADSCDTDLPMAPGDRPRAGSDRRYILMKFTRITVDPKQMGGVPCIRGLRIPVATVIAMVAEGMTTIDILATYPDLEREDVQEALHYAANAVRERELPLMAP